jgi:hypothetical protein
MNRYKVKEWGSIGRRQKASAYGIIATNFDNSTILINYIYRLCNNQP